MIKNTRIKLIVVRAAIGALFHASAFAGPPSYLYSQGSPLPHKPTIVVRTPRRPIFHKQASNARWPGMPRLLNVGQGVISINELDQ